MLLAAGRALVDQARLVRPGPPVAAGGAAEPVRPARRKQVRPALLVAPEALEEARQIVRQVGRQHRVSSNPRVIGCQATSTRRRSKPNLTLMDS